ncbi:hypothetical protein CXQ52_RS08890 [Staphylococcus pseudintermedius]|nr:hypothetical protein [Staphylococcus pseudintermedius]
MKTTTLSFSHYVENWWLRIHYFEAGLSIQEVQDRLGHGDIKTNMDIYAHVTEKQRDQVAEKFANDINWFFVNVGW